MSSASQPSHSDRGDRRPRRPPPGPRRGDGSRPYSPARFRTPRRRPPLATPAQDTRARLLAVSADLFAAHGFDGVSVREVCSAARANVSAVTYHFGGKDGLYLETLREGLRGMKERMDAACAGDDSDPARALVRRVRAFVEVLLCERAPWAATRLLMAELARPTAALSRVVDEFMRPNFEAVADAIRALSPPETPEPTVRLWALTLTSQICHARNAAPVVRSMLGFDGAYPRLFPAELARHVLEQFFRAVGRPELAPLAETAA